MLSNFILPALFVAAFGVLPGVLVSFAFFRGKPFGVLSKAVLGAIFGLTFAPLLSFIEYLAFGASYGFQLVILNSLILWALAIGALWLRGMLSFDVFESRAKSEISEFSSLPYAKAIPKYGAVLALLLLAVLAFYIRYSTGAAFNFFEFDPIFYDHISEMLATQGSVPFHSFEVYWPIGRDLHMYPLVHYVTVGWVHAVNALGGLAITKELVVAMSQLYPPLVAVFMVFLAYLLFKELFGELTGLFAAAVFALMPQLVKKLAAGVSEMQPFGIFAAIFVFAAYALYLQHRDRRFAVLTGFAAALSVLSSAQAIWPLLLLGVSGGLIALLEFRNRELDSDGVINEGLILVFAAVAVLLLNAYQGSLAYIPSYLLVMAASFASYAVLWMYQQYALSRVGVSEEKQRVWVPLAFVVLAFLVILFVPFLNQRILGNFVDATSFAVAKGALTRTVAEENATSPDMFPSIFGDVNPELTLLVAFLAVAAIPVFNFFKRGRMWGFAALALVLLITVFNPVLDSGLKALSGTRIFGDSQSFTDFVTTSDVFLFTLVAIVLLFFDSYVNGTDNRKLIFLTVIVFPVSYIGMRKLKYLLHLSVSVALGLPLLFGQAKAALDHFERFLTKDSDKRMLFMASTAAVLIIGVFTTFALAKTVPQSMAELGATRIPQDWLDTYKWMAANPNMTTSACTSTYGYDCRVLSWWDYGHWTTFFGGKQSVLDPGNAYPAMDQEVAKSFVEGNINDMKYVVSYRQATHILVDMDLIGKWGALVFLSGTCSQNESSMCPVTPPVDVSQGPGKSKYEAEHYFEYMYANGQCPQGVSPVPLPAYRSQLTGATYCLSKSHLLLLTQSGVSEEYQRAYKLVGRDDIDPAALDANTSYLFNGGQSLLINVNPDLSYAGFGTNAFNAAFTRLFFFESLPGTKLEYRSQNGMVKVFSITKGGPLLP